MNRKGVTNLIINLDFNIKDDTIHEFKKVMLPDVEIETLNVKTLEENSDIICLLYTSDAADE